MFLKAAFTVAAVSCLALGAHAQDDTVHLNQIQVIGTHNSYHAGFAPSEAKLWQQKSPKLYAGLDYRHPALTKQLDGGVRQIELDIYADTKGGLYAHPYVLKMVAQAGLPADADFDPQHLMDKPGFKVMHVQDVDVRSVCQPFTACLAEVRAWSKAHPGHLPIFILVETKEEALKVAFPATVPEPFTAPVFDALDAEIESVFPADERVTPDAVRGSHATLDEAVREGGWPTLAAARGKVVFLLDQRHVGPIYVEGHASLKGRVLFTNAAVGSADGAFTEENDGTVEEINAIVRQGYLVRTRTDSDTVEARTNDTKRRDAVMSSGAQILSTDYPVAETAASGYSVGFAGGAVARCNHLIAPAGCAEAKLEPRQ